LSFSLLRPSITAGLGAENPPHSDVQFSRATSSRFNEEVEKYKLATQAVEARKNNCTSFGFTPDSDAHAQCVMQLFIAEQAQANSATRAAPVQSTTAAEAAMRQQAEQLEEARRMQV
jgi:hypothetical protein